MTRIIHLTAALLLVASCGYEPSPESSRSLRAAAPAAPTIQAIASSPTPVPTPVPGPAGLLGVAAALAWARALRKRFSDL